MNVFKWLTAFFAVTLAALANAELNPLPTAPENPLTERPRPFPAITCANLTDELAKLKGMSNDHNLAVASFMDDVIVAVDQWHQFLAPLEGQSVEISKGQFDPIREGQNAISEAQTMVWDNMSVLEGRFDEVLKVLPRCLK